MKHGVVAVVLFLATFGVVPAQADDAEPQPWSIPDGSGDAYLMDKDTGVQPPANPLSAYADLLRIEMARETEEALEFAFVFADLKPYDSGTYPVSQLTTWRDQIFFTFDIRGASVHYDVEIPVRRGGTTEPPGFGTQIAKWDAYDPSNLCIRAGQQGCFKQPVETAIDYQQNAILLTIPKSSLLGRGVYTGYGGGHDGGPGEPTPNQPPPGTPTRLDPGSTLEKFRFSYAPEPYGPVAPGFYDEAPNSGEAGPYKIQTVAANQEIAFQGRDSFQAEIGERTTIQVQMENYADFKRIVNLTHTIEPPEMAGKVHLSLPPTVTLPRGRPVNLSFVVDVDPSLPVTQEFNLTLRGQSLGHPNELAVGRLHIVPTMPLSVRNPTLYLHVHESESSVQVIRPDCILFGCGWLWLSPLREDPRETPDVEYRARTEIDGTLEAWMRGWAQSAQGRPLALEGEKPVTFKLKLKAPVDATLHAEVVARTSAMTVAEVETDVSVTMAGSLVEIPVPPVMPNMILSEGGEGRLGFYIVFTALPNDPAGSAVIASGQLTLIPKESQIDLPITTLPETLLTGSLLAPVTLQVPPDRQEEFVNAGEARLFNVTLLNRGERADTVHLVGAVDQPNWRLQLLPGDAFRLNPGESVTLGVLVGTPADAAEGTIAAIRLNATGESLPDEAAFLRLTLTVTNNIPLGDDSGLFQADADTKEKLVADPAPHKGVPGFEALTLAAALLVFVRRRRRGPLSP